MPSRQPTTQPKPWPMKWVVLAIVVFIVGYTFINLRYRKPGKGHEPAAEMKQRYTAAKLKEAGWEKMPVDTRRPAEKIGGDDAPISRGLLGLGMDFTTALVDKPGLLKSIDQVSAPASAEAGADYTAYFTGSLSDLKYQLGDIELYRRGNELVLLPTIEHLPGKELYSRWNDANYSVTFSTRNLPPGTYEASLLAQGPAAKWSFRIR